MSSLEAVLIPGDGIGPEVADAARQVLAASGVDIHWHVFEAGLKAQEIGQDPLPEALVEAVRATGVALKGPITTPVGYGFTSVNVGLRRALDLFVNLRPIRSLPGTFSRFENVDLVIIRENTEGLYIGDETWLDQDTVIAAKLVTRSGSTRIARFAFDYAQAHGRSSVTAVHKANILKESDGLFLSCARKTAADYPGLLFKDRIIDALCMDLVVDPARHDVMLCPNLYGDIVSDLAAGLVGGLGTVPGANLGHRCAIFEAVHGSAPDIAGQGIANPTALILAGILLLRHLGENSAALRIEQGLDAVYTAGANLPPDMGGSGNTQSFTETLIKQIS
ncbi:MAG: NAD-dependent isocitrate dehydrogenase [Anaerolineales bacterium]|nr:NAD-dependent isocitrate dehydrogenase [Anaerolineales bacterium]